MKTEQFLCGVIEGYYGRPWSFNQRRTLFENCLRFGLNTYVYAPKDDAKHRSRWRDLYTAEESTELSQLIHLAKHFGLHFIYALSPGLDITYSSEKDMAALKRKFDQLSSMGCEHWALLFDDIEDEMTPQDKERFASFAHAQVAVTNQIYEYLNKPNILIFCPTDYCSRMAKPSLEASAYLQTVGSGLHPDIDIFWTGPKVVSRRITVDHIRSVNAVVQRRVTIWDNLNANDYDLRRLCMGPFAARPSDLSSHVAGMLANPNCEFELNFIPLHTLGQWFESWKANDEESIHEGHAYQADKAFQNALVRWLPEFNRIKSANDAHYTVKIEHSPQAMSPKTVLPSLLNDEDSQDSISENITSSKVHTMECDAHANALDLTLDDVRLLVELFYLPYEHGPNAQQIFLNFYWLRFNYSTQQDLSEWRRRASAFHEHAKTVGRLLQKMVAIHNRALLYDVYNYINDINSTFNLCSKYLQWLDDPNKCTAVFMSGDVEPWSIRGGLAGEFLNILPLGDFQATIKSDFSASSNIYFIRPLASTDQLSMYALCTSTCRHEDMDEVLRQHADVVADRTIGGYLTHCLNDSDLCFGVESSTSNDRLCGFALTISESEKYDKLLQGKWLEQIQQKYPNVNQNFFETIVCPQWIYDRYSVRVQLFLDATVPSEQLYSIGQKLVRLLTNALRKRGCTSCHALLDERNNLLHQLYLRLGFVDVPLMEQSNHVILVGKQF